MKNFRLGDYLVRPQLNRVSGPGAETRVEPKMMEVLVCLAEHAGEVLSKEQIIQKVWAGTFVTDEVRTNAISELRKALGDSAREPRFIETIPRRGYRIVAAVQPDERPETRRRFPVVWIALLTALTIAGVAGALIWTRIDRNFPPAAPHQAPVLTRLTTDIALNWQPSLSRDGKLVAYASDRGTPGTLHIWVQPVAGGPPIQRTSGISSDSNPSFSPDGNKIVFASQRNGGGVYVTGTLAGEERVIAAAAFSPNRLATAAPRFSPDGTAIAYARIGLFLVPSGGGPSRKLTDVGAILYPIWSPDGRRILFAGARGVPAPPDWWVIDAAGGEPVSTGAQEFFRRARFRFDNRDWRQLDTPRPAEWLANPDRVVFSAQVGDSRELWQVPISREGRITGNPEPLTTGAGLKDNPSLATDGSMAFHTLSANADIWSVPIDAETGRVIGSLTRITESLARELHPFVSADGRKLVFRSNRSGNWDVWLKELETGTERQMTESAADEPLAAIAGDGSVIAYTVPEGGKTSVHVAPAAGGVPRRLCHDCKVDFVAHLSHDGRLLVGYSSGADPVYLIDVTSGEQTELYHRPDPKEIAERGGGVYDPRFSPDGHWIAFHSYVPPGGGRGGRRLFVAPLRGVQPIPRSTWIAATEWSGGDDGFSWWSPGGNVLYFISDRDGYLCIWAQQLDSTTKHPMGPARAVQHLHDLRRSMGRLFPQELKVSVASNRLVFVLEELTGEIWLRR